VCSPPHSGHVSLQGVLFLIKKEMIVIGRPRSSY
jgi:hypothetical protein